MFRDIVRVFRTCNFLLEILKELWKVTRNIRDYLDIIIRITR